ncbi:MAG: T9SS type A sorting domain-containing protein [Chitinophagales bacterium]|nr:T9SS type A sorting domain-containing protein [Chitinophagales bacterium]
MPWWQPEHLYVDDIVIGVITGLIDLPIINELSIFPNPASDFVNVSLNNRVGEGDLILSVKNAIGKTILEKILYNIHSEINIPTGSFATGIYFIRIFDGENIYTNKFIKN